MTGGVDQERAVLQHNNFRHAADEKTAERADPAVPQRADQCRQTKAHQHREQMNMSMLPHHERIFFEIGHVIERRLRPELEQEPADVRVKKTFRDVVRVFVMIDMFMVATVIARPHQYRILKRGRAENDRKQTHRESCAKRRMRKQAVITERDAESGRDE